MSAWTAEAQRRGGESGTQTATRAIVAAAAASNTTAASPTAAATAKTIAALGTTQ